jgi:hypothetical protein
MSMIKIVLGYIYMSDFKVRLCFAFVSLYELTLAPWNEYLRSLYSSQDGTAFSRKRLKPIVYSNYFLLGNRMQQMIILYSIDLKTGIRT